MLIILSHRVLGRLVTCHCSGQLTESQCWGDECAAHFPNETWFESRSYFHQSQNKQQRTPGLDLLMCDCIRSRFTEHPLGETHHSYKGIRSRRTQEFPVYRGASPQDRCGHCWPEEWDGSRGRVTSSHPVPAEGRRGTCGAASQVKGFGELRGLGCA